MTLMRSVILTLAMIAIFVGSTGCGNQATADTTGKKEIKEAIPVETATIEKGSITAYFTGTASLEAEAEAIVIAKIGGVVEKIFAEEGQQVKTGDILAQLDDDKPTLDLAQAEARLKQLENEFNRNKELFEKKIVSQEAFERIHSDLEMQKAIVGQSRLQKDYTSIRAPFTGIVSERMIKVGNMVPLLSPCFRLTDFDPLLAILHVPEKELNKLKPNQIATLEADALAGQTFPGKILRISPIVDSQSGTFKVTVAVTDPNNKLKPGMFARLKIVYDVRPDAILAPKDAVLTEGDESIVFTVTKSPKDNTQIVKRKIVEIGYINTSHMEIKAGLLAGETVVVTGISGLKDGSIVEILPTNSTTTPTKG